MSHENFRIAFDFDEYHEMLSEPIADHTPSEVEEFFLEDPIDERLAFVFAGVFNEEIYLTNEIEANPSNKRLVREYSEKFTAFGKLKAKLCAEIFLRMGIRVDVDDLPIGYYYKVIPFMEKNGFRARNRIFVV